MLLSCDSPSTACPSSPTTPATTYVCPIFTNDDPSAVPIDPTISLIL